MTQNKSNETALDVVNPTVFPVAATAKAMEVMRANLGGELPTPADFTRIRVPAGGGTTWEIPSIDGDPESAKSIDGVIVYIARRRAYWASTNLTGEPPQCASNDCITGIGNPGGACEKCPFNQFGSATKGDGSMGRGKACKESKLIFLLRANQTLPDIVIVPPGSLRVIKSYQLKIGVPYWSIVTRLSLERVQNKDGIAYAQIKPSRIGMLDEAAARQVLEFARGLQAVFEAAQVEHGDLYQSEPVEG